MGQVRATRPTACQCPSSGVQPSLDEGGYMSSAGHSYQHGIQSQGRGFSLFLSLFGLVHCWLVFIDSSRKRVKGGLSRPLSSAMP